jgi:cell division initiation protein
MREVESIKRESENLRTEIEQLRQLRTNYFIRCRALIRSQSELLSAMEADQQKDFEQPAVPQNDGYVLT